MHLPNPVQIATPFFILFVILEMMYVRFLRKEPPADGDSSRAYEVRDTAASLMMGLGSTITGALFAFIFVGFGLMVLPYRLTDLGWSLPVFVLCFVADDLIYYLWHWASHRVRWLWADHVQHHSSQHYNLSTALRQPWTAVLTFGLLFRIPLIIAGFPLPMIAFVHGLNLIYQFWIHTEAIGRMPAWFEAVMNTPSHHRVHHATNARYLDSNYAGVFIVWDRLFGTFVAEDEADKPHYGIVKNLGSFNPLSIAFHEWAGLASDLASARSLGDVFGFLFLPPGWTPDGSRETSDSIKARWAEFRSKHPQAPAQDLVAAE